MRTFNAALFQSRVPSYVLARCSLHLDGQEVYWNSQPDEHMTTWSSCCRTYNALSWGCLFAEGRFVKEDLKRLIRDLFAQCPTAQLFEDNATFAQMLSTTIGGNFSYSDGDTWPNNHQLFAEFTGERMHDYINRRIIPAIGTNAVAVETSDDKTMRVNGSCRNLAPFGELMRRQGVAPSGEIIAPDWYVRLMSAGGTYGDGIPNPREGYQTHLWKSGTHSESGNYRSPCVPDDAFFAYGGTDRAVVATVPSLGLVIARHNSNHGYPVDTFLDAACQSVEGTAPIDNQLFFRLSNLVG